MATTVRPDEVTGDPAVEPSPVVIVQHTPSLAESVREAWSYRRILPSLAVSVLRAQYRMTILGLWWVPITVLFATVGRTLIFGRLLNIPSAPGVPYFLFMLVGTLAWSIFDRSLMFALKSFQIFSRVTRDLSVPLPLMPIAATAQGLYLYAVHGGLVVVALGYYSFRLDHLLVPQDATVLFAPLAACWLAVLAWGMGFFIAPIYARARDIRFILRMAMPFWMYITPIIYPLTAVGERAALVAQLNPVATPIELFKKGVFGEGTVTLLGVLVSTGFTLLILVGGLAFMNRYGAQLVGIGRYDDEDDEEELR